MLYQIIDTVEKQKIVEEKYFNLDKVNTTKIYKGICGKLEAIYYTLNLKTNEIVIFRGVAIPLNYSQILIQLLGDSVSKFKDSEDQLQSKKININKMDELVGINEVVSSVEKDLMFKWIKEKKQRVAI